MVIHESAYNVVTRSIRVNVSRWSHGLAACHTDRVPLLNYSAYNKFSLLQLSQHTNCNVSLDSITDSVYDPYSGVSFDLSIEHKYHLYSGLAGDLLFLNTISFNLLIFVCNRR